MSRCCIIKFMSARIKSNNNVVYQTAFHVVWCVKYRREILDDAVQKELIDICREVCQERQADIIEIECMKDHIHLLVSVDPQYGIHRLVKQIKGRSSRRLREKYLKLRTRVPSLWTNSYFVSTVGGAPLEAIKEYVRNQKSV